MKDTVKRMLRNDPYLVPYEDTLIRRLRRTVTTLEKLTEQRQSLADFASGHEYFGLHFRDNRWIFREWAPNASAIFLIGDMTDWHENQAYELRRINSAGTWEITLDARQLRHGDHFRLSVHWIGGRGDRIPSYSRRVVFQNQIIRR